MTETRCELCGSRVKVVGKTTLHYEPTETENKRLREVLADLVEIERRDNTGDPDITATDSFRAEIWAIAKEALKPRE